MTSKLPRSGEIVKSHAAAWFFGGLTGGLVAYLITGRDLAIGALWFVSCNFIGSVWTLIRIDKLISYRRDIWVADAALEEAKPEKTTWVDYRLSVDTSPTDTLIARFDAHEWHDLREYLYGLKAGIKPGYRAWKERGWSQSRWSRITNEMYRLGFLSLRGNETRTGYRVTREGWKVVAGWHTNPPTG